MSDIQTHLRKLGRINKGDDVRSVARSDRINAMQELIKSLLRGDQFVTNRNTIRKRTSEGLTQLDVNRASSRFPATTPFPWEITIENNSDGQAYVAVYPGTINNLLPTNIFLKDLFINITGTYFVVLHVDTDGNKPTLSFLQIRTEPPQGLGWDQNIPPLQFDLLLGLVVDSVPFQLVSDLLLADPIAGAKTLRDPLIPGEPYYDINYSWLISHI
jgi:hypothetical protein